MSRHDNADDDLGGFDQLSNRQQWAVSRFRARTGRYHRDQLRDDPWRKFEAVETEYEQRQIWRGGNP